MKIFDVAFTDHATMRWNERVGPNAHKIQLNILIGDLIKLNRVQFTGDMGIIDNDICFCYCYDTPNKIVIETVLGRISLKPLLLKKEYVEKRYIFLHVEPHIIAQQQLPAITAHEIVQLVEINEQLTFNELPHHSQQQQATRLFKKKERMIEKAKQAIFKANVHAKKAEMAERLTALKMKRYTQQLHLKTSVYSSVFARPVISEALEDIEQQALEHEAVMV